MRKTQSQSFKNLIRNFSRKFGISAVTIFLFLMVLTNVELVKAEPKGINEDLCTYLQGSGWTYADPLGSEKNNGNIRVGKQNLCKVTKVLKEGSGKVKFNLLVFVTSGAESVIEAKAEIWEKASQNEALQALNKVLEELAKKSDITFPNGFSSSLLVGNIFEAESNACEFMITHETREGELVLSPDKDPNSIPLISINAQIKKTAQIIKTEEYDRNTDNEKSFELNPLSSSEVYERPKDASYFWWDTDKSVEVELEFEDKSKMKVSSTKEFSKKISKVKFINPTKKTFTVKLWTRF